MIKKNGHQINSVEEWGKYAGPKEDIQWKNHRSAKESAKAWFRDGIPKIPTEIKNLIENSNDFGAIKVKEVEPESLLRFDMFSGPSNMDVLVKANDKHGEFLVGIEAKADETFSSYVKDVFTNALETKFDSVNSKKVLRIEQLSQALFTKRKVSQTKIGELRYQLLTGLAGTIGEAINNGLDRAVFLIHEFVTPLTTRKKRNLNHQDLNQFIYRLTQGKFQEIENGELLGPIEIPGTPLFKTVPNLYVGKVSVEVN